MKSNKPIQKILTSYREQLLKLDDQNSFLIKRSLRFISENLYSNKLTIRWLKEQCRISDKSFATKFYCSVGYYPKEYILHHRIKVSKLLLKKTDATITLIALSVGFNSLSAFCKTFKQQEGQRPSEWQEKKS